MFGLRVIARMAEGAVVGAAQGRSEQSLAVRGDSGLLLKLASQIDKLLPLKRHYFPGGQKSVVTKR
jgi:hypothetical protein